MLSLQYNVINALFTSMLPWDHGGRRSELASNLLAILKKLELEGNKYKVFQIGDFGVADSVCFICSYPASRKDYDFQVIISGRHPYLTYFFSLCQPKCYFNGSWVDDDGIVFAPEGTNISAPLLQMIEPLWKQLSELGVWQRS